MDDVFVVVTDDDIRAARRLWLAALDDGRVPRERVEVLHDDLRRLIHTQAQQLAESYRAARRAAADEVRQLRRTARGGVAAD